MSWRLLPPPEDATENSDEFSGDDGDDDHRLRHEYEFQKASTK